MKSTFVRVISSGLAHFFSIVDLYRPLYARTTLKRNAPRNFGLLRSIFLLSLLDSCITQKLMFQEFQLGIVRTRKGPLLIARATEKSAGFEYIFVISSMKHYACGNNSCIIRKLIFSAFI